MYQGLLEPITNRQTWTDTFQVVDDDGVAVDISAATIGVYVRDQMEKCKTTFVLQGTNTDGHITFPNGGTDGIFSWTFTDTETRKMCAPRTHDVSIYVTIGSVVTPIAIVTISVLDGMKP
jgi:hypothetical protein